MGKRGASIIDIARIAGVSKTTVSNVLNGTGRVGEETRNLVLQIAEREGYVANYAAKSLRMAETKTVGILTPDISNNFLSSIVMRIERDLYERGYTSFVCDTENDPDRESSYVVSMQQKQVDGLVFVNGTLPLNASTLPPSIPTVVVDRTLAGQYEHLASVGNDVRSMAHDMAATLIRRGCTRIAFLVVSATSIPTEQGERYLGYMEALAEAGVRLDHKLVLRGMHKRASRMEAYTLIDQLLIEGVELDGVVAIGDRVAIGAMQALAAHGREVGTDVRVIGCDDSSFCRICTPQLSSVLRNVSQLAARATETLLGLMSGEEPTSRQIIIPHEVIERASTLGR
ncbi:MAG: LacI family DNA-binding transcriptional regulator [Atopobiaceae bacterium]|nr:LacI family DNA-binding transcriptional regulator [Atopobiaceae bacterium]